MTRITFVSADGEHRSEVEAPAGKRSMITLDLEDRTNCGYLRFK